MHFIILIFYYTALVAKFSIITNVRLINYSKAMNISVLVIKHEISTLSTILFIYRV